MRLGDDAKRSISMRTNTFVRASLTVVTSLPGSALRLERNEVRVGQKGLRECRALRCSVLDFETVHEAHFECKSLDGVGRGWMLRQRVEDGGTDNEQRGMWVLICLSRYLCDNR